MRALPLCKDAVGVFYSPSRLGNIQVQSEIQRRGGLRNRPKLGIHSESADPTRVGVIFWIEYASDALYGKDPKEDPRWHTPLHL